MSCGCRSEKLGMPCNNNRNSAVDMRRPAPDSMRHGGFNFEVVGDDHADHGTHDTPEQHRRWLGTNPLTNQAGALAPITSRDGQAMRAAGFTVFMRQMDPILRRGLGFPNNVGTNTAQSARNVTVVPSSYGYGGILPLSQQPTIDKPLPY